MLKDTYRNMFIKPFKDSAIKYSLPSLKCGYSHEHHLLLDFCL